MKKLRGNTIVEEKKQRISFLELRLTLETITTEEDEELKKLQAAIKKQKKYMEMSSTQRTEFNLKKRKIIIWNSKQKLCKNIAKKII